MSSASFFKRLKIEWGVMGNLFYIWVIVALLFVLLEIGHPGLFLFLSFALGALVTAFSAVYSDSLMSQCVIFLLASIGALVVLMKWVKKTIDKEHAYQHTNTQALVGRKALVIKDIYVDMPGEVKIGGELWMARALHDHYIPAETQVIVVQVRGAHVVVMPVE